MHQHADAGCCHQKPKDRQNGRTRRNVLPPGRLALDMHEVIHWLRLMPYKLAKDRKRAPMFYAGLVMVANDVANFAKVENVC